MAKLPKSKQVFYDSDNRHDLGKKPNGKYWPPTCTYYPEYCDKLCELMAEGLTYAEVAKELKTSLVTMRNWTKSFPEFAEAWQMGLDLAEAYYQRMAREHLVMDRVPNGPITTFDTRNFIFIMKSRFKQYDNPPPVTVNMNNTPSEDVKAIMDEVTKGLHRSTI